jgi:hypothetical protein
MHFATHGRNVYMKKHKNEIDIEYVGHGGRGETKNRDNTSFTVLSFVNNYEVVTKMKGINGTKSTYT